MSRLWLFVVICLCVCFSPSVTEAQKAKENRKVHFLLVGDSNDNSIGSGIAANLKAFRVLHASLEMDEGDRRGELVVLDGEKANARDVLQAAAKLPTDNQDDAVICYVACHGAYDEKKGGTDPNNGHFFSLPGGDLMRSDLWKALKPEKRRLTVLITDTCNTPSLANPVTGKIPIRLPLGFGNMDKPKWKLARALFLRTSGVVDLSGSTKDQLGWFQGPVPGGWFTYQFVNAFCDPPFQDFDAVTWPVFTQEVANRTSEFYLTHRKQLLAEKSLAPKTHKLMEDQSDQRPQFFQLRLGNASNLKGSFYIHNGWSGKQLDYPMIEGNPDGAHLQAYRLNRQTNQIWKFEEVSPGVYRLWNDWSEKVMDNAIIEGNPEGSLVHGFKLNKQSNQMWVLEQLGTNKFRFQNLYTRKYLEHPNPGDNGTADEVKLNCYRMNGLDSQVWITQPVK